MHMRKFPTQQEAQIVSLRSKREHKATRAFQCLHCKQWHLTNSSRLTPPKAYEGKFQANEELPGNY